MFRRSVASVTCLLAGLLLVPQVTSCGAKSGLIVCDEGDVMQCSSVCGVGTRVCSGGLWSPCDARGVRECTNSCGVGSQGCENERWSECNATGQRSCTNECGIGEQTCENDSWSECDAVGERTCEDICGVGTQTCVDNTWTECDATGERVCFSICGEGRQTCENDTWSVCDAPAPLPPRLEATARDFRDSHPDFERLNFDGLDLGIVEERLGPDDKPVYAGNPVTPTTTGRTNFDQWYRSVPGINSSLPITIQLAPSAAQPGLFVYDNRSFFPIDDLLFGNEGRLHNYHFTVELTTRFRYVGGERFTFEGDDDLWVFINRVLAIDLGGVHQALRDTVLLDDEASRLGISVGNVYDLHLFFAERKTVDSTFSIETTIAEWDECP